MPTSLAAATIRKKKKKKQSTQIPPNVRRHAHMLCVLAKAKPKLVRQIVTGADASLVKTISECSYNILKGHVRLTATQKKRLSRYKRALRALADRKTSTRQRKTLMQRGGFLPLIGAAMAVPVIAGLARKVLGRVVEPLPKEW
jgi:glucan phosphorylase